MSLIAGGALALLMFAASARAQTSTLPLLGDPALVTQADGSGSGATTTTVGGTGSGSGVTTTTVGGTGSGVTTTTARSGSTTTTTAAGGTGGTTTTTVRTAALPRTDGCSPSIAVTLQSVRPGGTTSVSGQCFPGSVDISLILTSDPVVLGATRSDANGSFALTIAVPVNTAQGAHTLTASGGGASASIPLIVSTGGAFAVTGLSWNMAILGLALLAAGIIVLAGDRIGKQDLIEFV